MTHLQKALPDSSRAEASWEKTGVYLIVAIGSAAWRPMAVKEGTCQIAATSRFGNRPEHHRRRSPARGVSKRRLRTDLRQRDRRQRLAAAKKQ